jgi:colicin import membrane protein
MQLQRIPRSVVRTWLRTARLPLDAVESVARRGEHDVEWAPALAFDSFEASVKQIAGSILRDEELVQEGRVAQARVGQLRKAVELDALAEQRKAEADAEYQQRRAADEQRRRRVEQQAAAREAELEREQREKQRRLDEEQRRKREQAARVENLEEKVVEKQERAAKSTRISAEREALQHERDAVSAKKRVTNLDDKIEENKATRKSG